MPLVEHAAAKVNLTLQVLGRRPDGYHDIESVVAFADLADGLTFDPSGPLALDMGGPFAAACGDLADNLVLKAARRLAEACGLPASGRFSLDKSLPAAAGLGGGSADAAAALRLMARAHGLAGDDARLWSAARQVGADVPVCLDPRSRIMQGTGEILSAPLDVPQLAAVLVNPGVTVATRDVFAALDAGPTRAIALLTPDQIPRERTAFIGFLAHRRNDLEGAAIRVQPVIADVVAHLRRTRGCGLARMSGSGATCFGLYETAEAAASAERVLTQVNPHWWVRTVTLG